MRHDQIIGLSPQAEKWLALNCKVSHFALYCDREFVREWNEFKQATNVTPHIWRGMFGDEHDLRVFVGFNGHIFEVEQACPWSSGPMLFTTLKGVPQADWADEQIDSYL